MTFHHHEVVGAKMVRKRMRALKYSRQMIEDVSGLVFLHLRFHGYGEASGPTRRCVGTSPTPATSCPASTDSCGPTAPPATSGARPDCRPPTTRSNRIAEIQARRTSPESDRT